MNNHISYRKATQSDIAGIGELQYLFHVDSVSAADKPDGFVTTLFSPEQISKLIADENSEANVIIIAIDDNNNKIIGYAMNASWAYWSEWPFFRHMIAELPNVTFNGIQCTEQNSFQYGPVCVHTDYRGGQGKASVLTNLFEHSCMAMAVTENGGYPILLTFINHINTRSYRAHVDKLGLHVIKDFTYNDNNYYELGYDTSKSIQSVESTE